MAEKLKFNFSGLVPVTVILLFFTTLAFSLSAEDQEIIRNWAVLENWDILENWDFIDEWEIIRDIEEEKSLEDDDYEVIKDTTEIFPEEGQNEEDDY